MTSSKWEAKSLAQVLNFSPSGVGALCVQDLTPETSRNTKDKDSHCKTCKFGYSGIVIEGTQHCFKKNGMTRVDNAASLCKADGDKLPLPKSRTENLAFMNFWKFRDQMNID